MGRLYFALETQTPKIEAIAATDYYVADTYEQLLLQKASGRLGDVQLIFPNIEVRLGVAAKNGFVNLHLLVSPEDSDHLAEVQRLMAQLQFQAYEDHCSCTRSELIRLGRRANCALVDDRAALAHGATQFKVSFAQLREVLSGDEWARRNIIVAVEGGSNDGISCVR